MVLLRMSLFLQTRAEEPSELEQVSEDQEQKQLSYLFSLLRPERQLINIYRPQKEHFFQKNLEEKLVDDVTFGYNNFKMYQKKPLVYDMIFNQNNFCEFLPDRQVGTIDCKQFVDFVKACLPMEFTSFVSTAELKNVYKNFAEKLEPTALQYQQEVQTRTLGEFLARYPTVSQRATDEEKEEDAEAPSYLSLRSFLFSLLFQSPITVKQKLDIMYDIASYSNRHVDGIDVKTATNIFSSVLRQHQVYVPYNELMN